MVKTSSITEPYFSHDYSTREKKEIKKIIQDLGFEGYGLYWAIVEFMYRNELMTGEEALVIDKSFENKIKSILNNYNLFHVENNYYVSDRIIETIEKQEEKSKKSRQAIEARWIISDFCTVYKEVFEKEPVLSDEDITNLKKYVKKIENLRSKLPDILYTLKTLKFKNNPDFRPTINWLLEENNLGKLLNGGFGAIKSWSKHKEAVKKAELTKEQEELQENDISLDLFDSKIRAIEFIADKNPNLKFINPAHKELMRKFDISIKELQAYKDGKNV